MSPVTADGKCADARRERNLEKRDAKIHRTVPIDGREQQALPVEENIKAHVLE
jgi:hypothetical protein